MDSSYVKDLEFLYSKLIKHPLFIIDRNKLSGFERIYSDIFDRQRSFSDFINSMNLLTGFFGDGHTNIELPYTTEDKCLNIPCFWKNDKLLLAEDYEEVKCGAEVVSIENTPIENILSQMSHRIPHENIYLIKSRMINYPYKNYHVFSEMNLTSLFRKNDGFEVCFLSKGTVVKKVCYLDSYTGYLDFKDDEGFVSYELVGETAILYLNSCICNDLYRAMLDQLSDICNEKGITTLILDLSKNMGGSSAVIDEFIKHVDIDEFRRYEMIDYSEGKPEYITRRTDFFKNPKCPKCFHLDIYCRVSHDTFSSARTFAVTLKDNGIAKIIGSPTGGKPNSFGMPQKYKTPNLGIPFRVSRCLFLRPNEDADLDLSLFPDYGG